MPRGKPFTGAICPVHKKPMTVKSTTKSFRYTYCRVPGCKQSRKVPKDPPPSEA